MPQSAGGRGRDYRESDVEVLLAHGADWRTWDDAVSWLRQWGPRDGKMRSADVRELLTRDLAQLQREAVPFTHDSGAAFRLARAHRPARAGIERT